MRVLLVRPVPPNERFGLGPFFRIEPLGLEYIAAALQARGHEVTIADLRFTRSIERHVARVRPGLVGTVPSNARHSGRALTDCRILDAFQPVREDYRDGLTASVIGGRPQ